MNEAEAKANGESVPQIAEECIGLQDQIRSKENDLEQLIRELDDKVRFGQRPGSGAGRIANFPDRPPSQSGMPEEPRSMEFMERPRSRGSDVWTRPGDDRRAFQSGRERGFFANRDIDRYLQYFDSSLHVIPLAMFSYLKIQKMHGSRRPDYCFMMYMSSNSVGTHAFAISQNSQANYLNNHNIMPLNGQKFLF